MAPYEISFQIEGPFALWNRPDQGAVAASYPAPTWSALKSIAECVAFLRGKEGAGRAYIRPTRVEIGSPIRFDRYVTNYRGPLKETAKTTYQLQATVLVDVAYRVHCLCEPFTRADFAAAHQLQEMFVRRLQKGQTAKTPCLGWREFMPTYFGPFAESNGHTIRFQKQHDFQVMIPSLLLNMWDSPIGGSYKPAFRDVEVKNGEMLYPHPYL